MDWRVYNQGYNEREIDRIQKGKWKPNVKHTYLPEEWYQLIIQYEAGNAQSIKRRMDRLARRRQQISELRDANRDPVVD